MQNDEGRIDVTSPDGTEGSVPASQLQLALKKGYKPRMGTPPLPSGVKETRVPQGLKPGTLSGVAATEVGGSKRLEHPEKIGEILPYIGAGVAAAPFTGGSSIVAAGLGGMGGGAVEQTIKAAAGDTEAGVGKAVGSGVEQSLLATLPYAFKGAKALTRVPGMALTGLMGGLARKEMIAGVEVPILASEEAAGMESFGGKMVQAIKTSGRGGRFFERFETLQQQKVREVIKNVAQEVSGSKIVADHPAGVFREPAEIAAEQSKDAMNAVNIAVNTSPNLNRIILNDIKGPINKFLKSDLVEHYMTEHGEIFDNLGKGVKAFDKAESAQVTFSSALKVRGDILDAMEKTHNPTIRQELQKTLGAINTSIDSALESKPGLKAVWHQAEELSTKSYAFNSIANSIDNSIKGVGSILEESIGSPAKIQDVIIKGNPLTNRINDLADNRWGPSVFEKAGLSPSHIKDMTEVGQLMARVQATHTGSHSYISHGLAFNTMRMLGGGMLAKAMTTPTGTKALTGLLKAKNPEQVKFWHRAILSAISANKVRQAFKKDDQKETPSEEAPE